MMRETEDPGIQEGVVQKEIDLHAPSAPGMTLTLVPRYLPPIPDLDGRSHCSPDPSSFPRQGAGSTLYYNNNGKMRNQTELFLNVFYIQVQ